jgi:DNA-binding CsgD family transcriptional regulator
MTEVSTLSHTVGRIALTSAIDALNRVEIAAVAVDRFGSILGANDKAHALFDRDVSIRLNRLSVKDRQASETLATLFNLLSRSSDLDAFPSLPIVIPREKRRPLIVRLLPVHPAARSPFLGARALITLTSLEPKSSPSLTALSRAFRLTPAETRLVAAIADGSSCEQAAEKLGIARETARNQLKSVYSKTDTHRQSQLVALVARLPTSDF